MLAALRRAGSALPRHAASRMRERQRRRRCLPAEPDLPAQTLVNMTDVVHTEPAGHLHAWPYGPEGRVMTRGQSPAVTVAVDAADARLQLVSGDDAKLRQLLPASKLIPRRRSAEVRPGLASPHHPRCLVSLRQSAAGPPGCTLIASL